MRNSARVAAVKVRGVSISVSAPNGSAAAATTPFEMSLLFACRIGTKAYPPDFNNPGKASQLLFHFGVGRAGRYVPPSNR